MRLLRCASFSMQDSEINRRVAFARLAYPSVSRLTWLDPQRRVARSYRPTRPGELRLELLLARVASAITCLSVIRSMVMSCIVICIISSYPVSELELGRQSGLIGC